MSRIGSRAGLAALILLAPQAALAHERFVRHHLKDRLPPEFYAFYRRHPGEPLGLDPNLLAVALLVAAALAGTLVLWFYRQPLERFVQFRLLRRAAGPAQKLLHLLSCFLTDRPVRNGAFHTLGEWTVIAFLRSPALVLMYSATNDSLVMPSYPLDPASAAVFQYLQVILALLILTQTLLPLCGAMIFGTWIFLFNWGALVAIDAMPVLTVAVVYVTSPWQSHRVAITELNATQVRWIRLTLGLGFFLLGWLKIVNHDLVAGVAQNYPAVMEDPMIGAFTLFTAVPATMSPATFQLATWIVAFALAEVMSGFMLMTGVFTRVWCAFMAFVFTKLMLVDFGWAEIPHLYPIAALLALMTSNRLSHEFGSVEALEERHSREGRLGRQALTVGLAAVAVAVLVVFPPLVLSTFVDRFQWGLSVP